MLCGKKIFLLFSFLLIETTFLFALDPEKSIAQYGQTTWQRKNGLPSNAVNVVLQTHDGYVWLGTSAGLFRFDGVSFTKMNINKEGTMSYEGVVSLCEASDGSLWIGTAYDGLRQLKNGTVKHYGKNEGFFDTQVKEILETRTKKFLIGTSIGVFLFDHDKFIPFFNNPNFITALAQDSSGNVWIGTHVGVYMVTDDAQRHVFHLSMQTGLPNDNIQTVYIDHHANVWIGTADGLSRWKNRALKNFTIADGLPNVHINALYQDRNDNLWVGTQGGLCRY
ncbi:MAG TPA: two-component regulator propeller domain-containing protein, partial [Bacteroidota bacterium]|nr:two-component regulator propeller domain-containing protein [Bacteroidota bacterium]